MWYGRGEVLASLNMWYGGGEALASLSMCYGEGEALASLNPSPLPGPLSIPAW
jgi:hypothetical protein